MEKKNKPNQGTDRQLAVAARDAIQLLTTIPQEGITVTAHKGHLQLDGRVQALHQRTVLEEVTRTLPGVHTVTNLICVEADPACAQMRAVAQ